MKPEEIIEAYDALIDRAVAIADRAPYWKNPELDHASLTIDGDVATLTWPRADSCYGDCYLESNRATFPVSLLLLDDAEFEAWKLDQMAIYNTEQTKKKQERESEIRRVELFELIRLSSKYGAPAKPADEIE